MASFSSYSEDLTCSVCLTIFTDPGTLPCGHSFCRKCITMSLTCQNQCPQCRIPVPKHGMDFTINHILKSLAEKSKETERLKKEYGNYEDSDWFCPEHEEKLKLFCVTDQQLACIICRDCERHEGHKFKPIKEAAASLRKEFEAFVKQVSDDNIAVGELAKKQKDEITKTKKKSQQVMNQISSQFEEMHQFLAKRENEIKKELKLKENGEVKVMSDGLNAVETVLSEGKELEKRLKSVLEITDPDKFIKNWTEDKNVMKAKNEFRPKRTNLSVVKSSLSLMPYESHLQFFMWKEMVQVIKSRPDQLSFKSQDPGLCVSSDGRSLMPACLQCQQRSSMNPNQQRPPSIRQFLDPALSFTKEELLVHNIRGTLRRNASPSQQQRNNKEYLSAFSANQFTSGQHYWEIDVGRRSYWELGIQNNFLKYDNSTYTVSNQNHLENLSLKSQSCKIGVYLNCTSNEISFYDADKMTLIYTLTSRMKFSSPVSAYFKLQNCGTNVPVTACRY